MLQIAEGPDKAACCIFSALFKMCFHNAQCVITDLMTQYKHVACISNYMTSLVFFL